MPVIEISERTMARLKNWAEPLVDTPDSVVAKILDAAEGGPPPEQPEPTPRRRTKLKLPQKEFHGPLMDVLLEMGGEARTAELQPLMKKRMSHLLGPRDFEHVSSGDPRWWNAVCWARNDLRKEGFLRSDSQHGVWELSEKGISEARKRSEGGVEGFVEHLLAIPDIGEDRDFESPRSDPREMET